MSITSAYYDTRGGSELRICVKVEVAVLGSLSLIVLMVSGDVSSIELRAIQLRSCVKVEVAVLGSPSLIIVLNMVSVLIIMVSVDVKQH